MKNIYSSLFQIVRVISGLILYFCITVTQADVGQDRAEGIAWLLTHQNGDGSWGQGGAKVAATSEVLEALRSAGVDKGFLYSRAVSWLANAKTDSVDSLARKIIALHQAGFDTDAMGLADELLARRNSEGGWGTYRGYDGGFPDNSLAILSILLSGKNITNTEKTNALSVITLAQPKDENFVALDVGWSYIGKSYGVDVPEKQIMPTAYNIFTLVEYVKAENWSFFDDVRGGINWLLYERLIPTNGSFLDNPLVTTGAVMKTALSYLAIKKGIEIDYVLPTGYETVLIDAQSYLVSQQNANGSWNNDPFHTALVLRTLAPATPLADTDQDGIPDQVEALVGTNPNVADGRDLIIRNGLNPDNLDGSDLAAPPIVTEILQGQAFSLVPILTGGTPAFKWSLGNGVLPVGITLNSEVTGEIAGTPTITGSFQFKLLVTDANGNNIIIPGFIRVIDPDDKTTDTDGDGLWSSYELVNGSNPLDKTSKSAPAVLDSDGDGLPDSWEIANGFNHLTAADINVDTDGDGLTDMVEFQLGTDPNQNNRPILVPDAATLMEDTFTAINVAGNDSDPDLNLDLSTILVVAGSSRTVVYNGDGTFTYTPFENFFGADSFIYKLCDMTGLCGTAVVDITVTPVNDLPVANAGKDRNVNEYLNVILDGTLSYDVEGPITYNWVQVAGPGVPISAANQEKARFLSPVRASASTLTFELTVTDGDNASTSDQVSVNVRAAPDSDGDGVFNVFDACPTDPDGTVDTDSDGICNYADTDDDNDGMSDVDEVAIGRNPLVNEAVIMTIINSLLLN